MYDRVDKLITFFCFVSLTHHGPHGMPGTCSFLRPSISMYATLHNEKFNWNRNLFLFDSLLKRKGYMSRRTCTLDYVFRGTWPYHALVSTSFFTFSAHLLALLLFLIALFFFSSIGFAIVIALAKVKFLCHPSLPVGQFAIPGFWDQEFRHGIVSVILLTLYFEKVKDGMRKIKLYVWMHGYIYLSSPTLTENNWKGARTRW